MSQPHSLPIRVVYAPKHMPLRAVSIVLRTWDAHSASESKAIARWLAQLISHQSNPPLTDVTEWYFAGLLHDVGKIAMPTNILGKRGALTADERVKIEKHTALGARLLKRLGASPLVVQAARSHHERWDGKGYPDGLRGRNIPWIARQLAVVDVYMAMVSARPYHPTFSPEQARWEIERLQGTQFDPEAIEKFFRLAHDD
ncbi:MAG: HD domain-containing protein [Chloroflexi bacterium]|nr:HD domain-containing protein [Chloroflexota bacterium]